MYRAREETFDRQVAVKVLNSAIADPEALARFQRECRALGQVDGHPNIVTVHSAGTTVNGHPYLIMAYEPNGSLQDRLDRGLRPEPQQLAKIGAELADALATAHATGVLHRDVKPANVLLSSREVPKLADFGIARLVGDSSRTKTGSITASIAHAPPEQVEGLPASPASDAYSLGSTMAALALGHPPFMTSDNDSLASVLGRLVTQDPPDLRTAGQSPELATLVSSLMRKDAADRPSDLAEVATSLRRMAESTTAAHATDTEVNFAPVPPTLQNYPESGQSLGVPIPGDAADAYAGRPGHGAAQSYAPRSGGGSAPLPPGYPPVPVGVGKRRTGLLVGAVVGALALMVVAGFGITALRDEPVAVQADVAVTRPGTATPGPTAQPTAQPTPTPDQQQVLVPNTPRPTEPGGDPSVAPEAPTEDPTPTPFDAPTDPEPPGGEPSVFSDAGLLSTTLVGMNDLPGEGWELTLSEEFSSPADVGHPVDLWDVCDQSLDPSQYGAAATNVHVRADDPATAVASTVVEVVFEPATIVEDMLAHYQACDAYTDSQIDGSEVAVDIFNAEMVEFEPYGAVLALQTYPESGVTFFTNIVVTDDSIVAIEADQRIGVEEILELVATVQLNQATLGLGPGQ